MLVDQLNINNLRVFMVVYQTKNMTMASKKLGLTQSAVSQHIKNLEEFLKRPLFDRIKKNIQPNHYAHSLYEKCQGGFNILEEGLSQFNAKTAMNLDLKMGLPIEFGNNIFIPELKNIFNEHPSLHIHFVYGHAIDMNQLLLSGDLHFALVDDYPMDPIIETETVYNEKLVLVANSDYLKENNFKANEVNSKMHFLSYTKEAPVLRKVLSANGKNLKKINLRAQLMDVQGMASMIAFGMGVGVLPYHFVSRLKKRGHKLTIVGQNKKDIINPIKLCWIPNKIQSYELQTIKEEILNVFKRD